MSCPTSLGILLVSQIEKIGIPKEWSKGTEKQLNTYRSSYTGTKFWYPRKVGYLYLSHF